MVSLPPCMVSSPGRPMPPRMAAGSTRTLKANSCGKTLNSPLTGVSPHRRLGRASPRLARPTPLRYECADGCRELRSLPMKIRQTKTAPNPRRVRVFLAEKGIEVPYEELDLMQGALKTPEF